MSVVKVLRLILLWILIGVKMQMVEAAEEEIPARQEMVILFETPLVPRLREVIRAR